MLAALFGIWEAQGHPHLPSMDPDQHIAYISDTGAFAQKPLFITGSVITVCFLDAGFMAERWLRHYGRLAPNTSRVQSTLSSCSIFFAIAGACGLIFLSIFDTYHHPKVHDGCLLLFIGGYVISAIFLCAEYQRLGIHYRQHRILALSFWIKLAFIIVEVILAIVFASTSWNGQQDVAAVFEWTVALIFTLWVLSFVLDLWPSVRSSRHVPQGWRDREPAAEKDFQPQMGQSSGMAEQGQGTYGNEEGYPANDGYRGTNATGGQNNYPAGHNDLGRQKKWGIGKFRF
jgi:hypothetical protein